MKKKRIKPTLPKILSEKEIEKLISIPSASTKTGIRNKAIISTFAFAGLRAMELISLKVKDIDLKEGWIHIKGGKTGDRDIPISPKLEPYLMAYNKLRPLHSRYFFTTHKGKRISDRYLRTAIKRYGKRIGLDFIHPHTLRHSFATHTLKRNDINTPDLQYLLGHKALSSTQVYTHVEPSDLHKKLRRKKDLEQKKDDLNNLFQQFLNKQNELANQVKEMLDKALAE